MSLIHLPTELLREIVQYLKPYNKHEPIVGLNAAWKSLSKFQESLRVRSRPIIEKELGSIPETTKDMVIKYRSLIALRSTCSLMRAICAPLLYEDLNVLHSIGDFEDYYSSVLVPNGAHIRNIRLFLNLRSTGECVKALDVCTNATSLAIYSNFSARDFITIKPTHPLCQAVNKLLREGNLNSLGIYSPWIIESGWLNLDPERDACMLLKHILENAENAKLVKCIDLACSASFLQGTYDYIRTKLPSLEVLGISLLLQFPHEDIWPLGVTNFWAPYSNLQRLQLRGCKAVYANRIPFLVRHFPSLAHVLFSGHKDNITGVSLRTEDWYDRDDALWKVRKPLETLHLEHVVDTDVLAMGEIPVKTLVITNSFGSEFIPPMNNEKETTRIFPGLKKVRIRPKLGLKVFDIIEIQWIAELEEFCLRRGILLTQDAEVTTDWL